MSNVPSNVPANVAAANVASSDLAAAETERDDHVIGVALRRSLMLIVLLGAAAGGIWYWQTHHASAPVTKVSALSVPHERTRPTVELPTIKFTDIARQAGIDFVRFNGAYGDRLLPETMGGGCAFLDYNQSGRQSILLINGCAWPGHPDPEHRFSTVTLYRNDGNGKFTDVTKEAGLECKFQGMGVAVGDFDNDGWPDLFISGVGVNRLFHNDHGKFVDMTAASGIPPADNEWGTSCGWFDYNNDGRLDLFVCHYVQWSKEIDLSQDFRLTGLGRAYGPPINFQGSFPSLYRNDGHGKFTDVSEAAGIRIKNPDTHVPMAKSLGVAFADLDGDGWMDVIVSNDTVRNFVFHNQHDGTFKEIGVTSGVAYDLSGNVRGAMGIDAARFRNSDTWGVAIGNFSTQMAALYVSQKQPLRFVDEAIASGLGPVTRQQLTFGMLFADLDLDGRLDLVSANGHVEPEINRVLPSQTYRQPPQLFWNCGPGQPAEFVPLPLEKVGDDFSKPIVGRGAAYADLLGNGNLDLLFTQTDGPPVLLRNDQQSGHHWSRFQLTGTKCNRDAIGAWVEVQVAGQWLRRQVMPTRSYLSQVELPVTIGLGEKTTIDQARIVWPDGTKQDVPTVKIDGLTTVTQAE